MNYKDQLTHSMEFLAKDPKTVFIGYNTTTSLLNNTVNNVNKEQIIELPLAENLMAGIGIGMSLKGYKPVLWVERFDFILNALDAIVNHLDKISKLSHKQYNPKMIIRVCIGRSKSPLYTGITHTQDFTEAMRNLVTFPVYKLQDPEEIYTTYVNAYNSTESSIIVESSDLYDTTK